MSLASGPVVLVLGSCSLVYQAVWERTFRIRQGRVRWLTTSARHRPGFLVGVVLLWTLLTLLPSSGMTS